MGGDGFDISNSVVVCILAQIIFSYREHRPDTDKCVLGTLAGDGGVCELPQRYHFCHSGVP